MVSVEEKVLIFSEELNSQVEKAKKEKLNLAFEEAKALEILADQQIKEQNQLIKERYEKQENKAVSKLIAEGKNESRDLLLKTRKEINQNFYELLLEKINEFLNSMLYEDYVYNSLKEFRENFNNPQEIKFYINTNEIKKFDYIIKNILADYDINFLELPKKNIGGFIIQDKDDRVNYDFSLSELISENLEKSEIFLQEFISNISNE